MGARIASNRAGQADGAVSTTDCDGHLADDRSVFYSGFVGCAPGAVSTEIMLRRFQARNNTTDDYVFDQQFHTNSQRNDLADQSGRVDADTLADLKENWILYRNAYEAMGDYPHVPASVINRDDQRFDGWIDTAVEIWESGLEGNNNLNASYTQEVHNGVLEMAGLAPNDDNRRSVMLDHWVGGEMPVHWGSNIARRGQQPYQPTEYRVALGFSDEHGSISFSQILYGKRLGVNPCSVQESAGLNPYDPEDNLGIFAIDTAADNSGPQSCQGGMYRAFTRSDNNRLGLAYNVTGPEVRDTINDLVGFRHADGAITQVGLDDEQDDYEKLAAAVAYYNSGTNLVGNSRRSWPSILKYLEYQADSTGNSGDVCHSCRYSIQIRQHIFGDNMRTYIWANEDGPEANAEPDWCFEYGEGDWVSGDTVPDENGGERLKVFDDYRDLAALDEQLQVPCL